MFTIGVPQMHLSGSTSIMVHPGKLSSLPSSDVIFLSLAVTLVLLFVLRVMVGVFRTAWSSSTLDDVDEKVVVQQRQNAVSSEAIHSRGYIRKAWSLIWKWERVHAALPISLTIRDEMVGVPVGKGAGVGLSAGASISRSEMGMQQPNWQHKRSGPAFESPLPAIYQSEVPVSMAKMIMSRHTIRRPSQRPPPKRVVTSVRQQHLV
jgi:hypothetical protein